MMIRMRAASWCTLVTVLSTSSLVVAQIDIDDRFYLDPIFRVGEYEQVTFGGYWATPELPLRQARSQESVLWSTDEEEPDVSFIELDLDYWTPEARVEMQTCTGTDLSSWHVNGCLDTVFANHGEPCRNLPVDCRDLGYYSSWCARRAQQVHGEGWQCGGELEGAVGELQGMAEVETGLGPLAVSEGDITIPRYMSDGATTTEHHLESEVGLICEPPTSRYYELDAFVHPDDPQFEEIREEGVPRRFATPSPGAEIASCGEAAYKAYLDFSRLEDDARLIDGHRSNRTIVDRIFYGGAKDGAPSHRPLADINGFTETATPDFRDWDDRAIRLPVHNQTWRGNRRSFKNVYWLIDREAQLPINGSTKEYRRQLRRFYATDLTWNYRMREALGDEYRPGELRDLAEEQKKLLEKYQRYLYLKSRADCEEDRVIDPSNHCTFQCRQALSIAGERYGVTFNPGGQPYLPSTLSTDYSAYPAYAHRSTALLGLSRGENGEIGEGHYFGPIGDGPLNRSGMPYGYPRWAPDPDSGIFDPPRGGAWPPEDQFADIFSPISPGPLDDLDRHAEVAGMDCLRRCVPELETIVGDLDFECPSDSARDAYADEAAEFYETEIYPALERGRNLGCIPEDPEDDEIPTPCDWADEELVSYFEQSYIPHRLAHWNWCLENFGPGEITDQQLQEAFLDPDDLPEGFPGQLSVATRNRIIGFRSEPYLENPDRLGDFLRNFREYQRLIAEAVFAHDGLLGPDGLRTSNVEEKSLGNDWAGTSMRAVTSSGQGMGGSRCETGVDSFADYVIAVKILGSSLDVFKLVGGGDSDETDPNPADPHNDWGLGGAFGLDVEVGGEVIFEPGDGRRPPSTTLETRVRLAASYRWLFDFGSWQVPLGPIQGRVAFGMGWTFGLDASFAYRYRHIDLPPEYEEFHCADPKSHSLSVALRPKAGGDLYVTFSVGTPGPVSIHIGVQGRITLLQLASEHVWSHSMTNAGQRVLPGEGSGGSDCIIPVSTASTNGYNETYLTLLAGEIAVVLDIVIGFATITLLRLVFLRFGGIRVPLSKIGELFNGIDACMVAELAVGLSPNAELSFNTVPEDCPCVFRRSPECLEVMPGESGDNLCQ